MKRIRVPIVYLVYDVHQPGRMEKGIHEKSIPKINGYMVSFPGICTYGRHIVLRYCTKFSGARVETEYATVLTFVDALLPVKNTAKVKVFDRCLTAIAL